MAVQRVEGVQEASFSYERAEGFVTYDPATTSPEEFLAELARMTDFRGTVRESGAAGESASSDDEGTPEREEHEGHEDPSGNDM